jgi:hypothetical protein
MSRPDDVSFSYRSISFPQLGHYITHSLFPRRRDRPQHALEFEQLPPIVAVKRSPGPQLLERRKLLGRISLPFRFLRDANT